MVKIHNSKDKILVLLLNNNGKEFTIRYIAKQISVDYKTVHIFVNKLAKDGVINTRKVGQTILCSINQKIINSDLLRAESIRKKEILKNKNLYVLYNYIKEDVKSPFFILLLFGSFASGKYTKKSDIDLLLISDDEAVRKRIKKSISLTPLKIHLLDFSSKEFLSMLKTTEFNVGKEAFNNNVIFFGIEDYYRLLQNA